MFIFIGGVVLGAVPQYLKLILLASADGISLTSLALMNVSNVTATLNIFILHFEQIKRCVQVQPGFTFNSCQASLLTFYYTLVYTLLWFPLYPLAAHFCSDEKSEQCGMMRSGKQHAQMGLIAHLTPCVILAAPVVRMVLGGACFDFENYAMFLGAVNAILEATRYLPQVYASFYAEGSGALSYLRLLLSIGGGVGATVQKALMKEDISTWFPPLVGHSLEIMIVVINLYNDLRGKKPSSAHPRTPGGSEIVDGEGAGGEGGRGGKDAERGGAGGGSSERTPLTGGDAAKTAAVNQAMERGESRGRAGGGGDGGDGGGDEGADDSELTDDDSADWLDGMPRDRGLYEQGDYVYQKMCTDPKFFKALVKYM